MPSIEASIKLYEDFTQRLAAVDNAMNRTIAIMERLRAQMQMAVRLQIEVGNAVAELQRVKELLAALGPGNAIQLSVNSEQVLQQLRTVRQQIGAEYGASVLEVRLATSDFAAQLATIQSSLPALQLSIRLDTAEAIRSVANTRDEIQRGIGVIVAVMRVDIPDLPAQLAAIRAAVPPISITAALNAGEALRAASLLGVQLQTRIGTITAEVRIELPESAAVRSQLHSLIHGLGSNRAAAIRVSVTLDTARALHQATLLRSQIEARIGTITARLNLTLPATLDSLLRTLITTVDRLRLLVNRMLGSRGGGSGGGAGSGGRNGSGGLGGGIGLGGLVGGYLSMSGIKALGEATIGGAMEQQKMIDMFIARTGDAEIGTAMFEKFKDDALKAGQDVNKSLQSTLSFFSATQNTDQLTALNRQVKQLNAFDSAGNGIEGAAFALKEAMSGDIVSLAERFNMSKTDIRAFKIDELGKTGDIDGFIKAFDKLLEKQKMGQAAFEQMMESPAKQMETLGNNARSMLAEAGAAAVQSLMPLITELNAAFQAGKFDPFFASLSAGLDWVVRGGMILLDTVTAVYNFFNDNWKNIEPIVYGLVAAFAVWEAGTLAVAAAQGIAAIATGTGTAAIFLQTLATSGLSAAWATLNTVMKANIFIFIASAILALIVYLYQLWQTNDQFAAAMLRAWNVILGFFDKIPLFFMRVGYGIADAFGYAKVASLKILEDLANGAIDRINGLIKKLKDIPGVTLDTIGYVEFAASEAVREEAARQSRDAKLAAKESALSAKAGEREADVQKFLKDREDKRAAAEKKSKDEEAAAKAGAGSAYNFDDWNKRADAARTPYAADDTLKKVDKVGKIEKPIDISKEDMRIMRDVAEMKNIQNFVTLTPTVQVKTGPVNSEAHVDSIVKKIGIVLAEEVASSAKGVYS
ncbi:DUF4200 domain-containing protein [Paenibacillus sp. FSL R7-0273]|uniref:DUF4200 domain-containing protein n=1 Tax=Paenibacillus sp. FSL R7-0273 TaxID=1536772 RepID=UPI0006943584|nr:DUF4200 domain-containing protein [Paenibacillus sp. FSL R7-0273]OMF95142.1 hypothetical protein BK144_06290 [Paenibacillus sp. FSL R7-0273]